MPKSNVEVFYLPLNQNIAGATEVNVNHPAKVRRFHHEWLKGRRQLNKNESDK